MAIQTWSSRMNTSVPSPPWAAARERRRQRRGKHQDQQHADARNSSFPVGLVNPVAPPPTTTTVHGARSLSPHDHRRHRPHRPGRHGREPRAEHGDHGFTVAVYNRTTAKVDDFLDGPRPRARRSSARTASRSSSRLLKRPRKVMIMVKAGAPVDAVIDELVPLLEPGDIVIDGGNSLYTDTDAPRRGSWPRRGCSSSAPASPAARRARGRARRSCPAATPRPGRTSSRSSRRSPPRSHDGTPCCDWVGPGRRRATTSRWSTTASSTATCSSSGRGLRTC